MTLNFLTKRKQKPGSQSLFRDLKKLISVPSSVLFFGVAVTGLQWGVHDTFLFVYFQEELKASTALVSYMVVVGSLSVFLSLFFINKIIDWIGTANSIFLHIIAEAARMMAYSYIKETPPYFALGLAATDFTFGALSWVAAFKYAIKITPPPLAATVSSLISLTEFIICK